MDQQYEQKYHSYETTYWWFKARRDMILNMLKDMPKDAKMLEVGCSGGILLEMLTNTGFTDVQGIDISQKAIDLCKKKKLRAKVMKGEKLSFKANTFDLIIASDVLEHIKSEQQALAEWHRVLRPGGKLIIFVPAFMQLWSTHDTINHHYRRYTNTSLANALNKANFMVQRTSYWNFSLFFPVSASRLLSKNSSSKPKDHLPQTSNALNQLLFSLLTYENKALSKINYPVGVSVFAVGVKPQLSPRKISKIKT